MNKQLLLLSLLLHCWLAQGQLINEIQNKEPGAFYRIGIEMGLSLSTFIPDNQLIPIYNQRLGGRLGIFALHRLHKSFDLRTGLMYTLRGLAFGNQPNPYNQARVWSLHGFAVPLMLFYHLSDRVNIALGVEFVGFFDGNLPVYRNDGDIGLRGSCGFYITPRCRIAAYYSHGLQRYLLNAQPANGLTPPYAYNNIISGISVSYEFHQAIDYSKAPRFEPPCPRLL
ncbi:MAG: outer membrane beta-barrel protein [Aureispira sp.]